MNVFRSVQNVGNFAGTTLPILCPGCHHVGNATPTGQDLSFQVPLIPGRVRMVCVGHRVCPNPKCATHMFVVYEPGAGLVCSYPVGRIDFDASGVPEKVQKSFEEALTCAAHECYIGAGMLLRKTLEAVCEDRAATGDNLKGRILDLKTKVTLPTELFDAMDHLRLLGNDAAHVEAKEYDAIGKEEIAAGVELTKEIIKATYQYKGLLGKLMSLKKP